MKTTRRKPRASNKSRRNLQRSQKPSSSEVVIKKVARFDATGLTKAQVDSIFRRFKFY
jgi:hypothetical protein